MDEQMPQSITLGHFFLLRQTALESIGSPPAVANALQTHPERQQ
jgi:hypothetical protein